MSTHKYVLWRNMENQYFLAECLTFTYKFIVSDKSGCPHNIFLILPQKIRCGYSLEVFQ